MKELFTVNYLLYIYSPMVLGRNGKKQKHHTNCFEACQRSFYIAKYFNKKLISSAVTGFVIK